MEKPRNLREFATSYPGRPMQLYRAVARVTGRSLGSVMHYCLGDYKPSDPQALAALSEFTGIPVEDLFRNFPDNE